MKREHQGGNCIARIERGGQVVAQKVYGERGGPVHAWLRELFAGYLSWRTPTRARGRRRTEAEILALWRKEGFDVPEDRSAEFSELANDRCLILEWIDGRLLSDMLADPEIKGERRRTLVSTFAREWCRRHQLALARKDARLVQEHGGVQHILVSGDRLTTFDLENSYLARRDIRPVLAKEIAAYIRSLARIDDPETFRRDLRTVVEAYPDRKQLLHAVHFYLNPKGPLRSLLWTVDRWMEERRTRRSYKYRSLEEFARMLGTPFPVSRRERIGAWLFNARGLVYPPFLISALLAPAPEQAGLLLGCVLLALHFCLRLSACRHIGGAARVHARKAMERHRLVTSGPFAWVRNPLYLSNSIGMGGVCLMLGPAWIGVAAIAGGLLWYTGVILWEERVLEQLYGEAYSSYRKQVPRLLPSWRHLRPRAGRSDFKPLPWRKVLRNERSLVFQVAAGVLLCLLKLWFVS